MSILKTNISFNDFKRVEAGESSKSIMTFWDKIKEWFGYSHKADALKLYQEVFCNKNNNSIETIIKFKELKNIVDSRYQDYFILKQEKDKVVISIKFDNEHNIQKSFDNKEVYNDNKYYEKCQSMILLFEENGLKDHKECITNFFIKNYREDLNVNEFTKELINQFIRDNLEKDYKKIVNKENQFKNKIEFNENALCNYITQYPIDKRNEVEIFYFEFIKLLSIVEDKNLKDIITTEHPLYHKFSVCNNLLKELRLIDNFNKLSFIEKKELYIKLALKNIGLKQDEIDLINIGKLNEKEQDKLLIDLLTSYFFKQGLIKDIIREKIILNNVDLSRHDEINKINIKYRNDEGKRDQKLNELKEEIENKAMAKIDAELTNLNTIDKGLIYSLIYQAIIATVTCFFKETGDIKANLFSALSSGMEININTSDDLIRINVHNDSTFKNPKNINIKKNINKNISQGLEEVRAFYSNGCENRINGIRSVIAQDEDLTDEDKDRFMNMRALYADQYLMIEKEIYIDFIFDKHNQKLKIEPTSSFYVTSFV